MNAKPRLRSQSRFGDYELLEEIGRGGAGAVWRANHVATGKIVALKRVHENRFRHVSSLAREVRALQRIEHPGIVRILDFGESDAGPWYAMDLLTGQPLSSGWARGRTDQHTRKVRGQESTLQLAQETPALRKLRQESDLPPAVTNAEPVDAVVETIDLVWLARLLTLVRRLCAPLAFLHGEGLVHRDLKPSNVFICAGDTPVLTDFGLAWHARDAEGRERLEDLAGIAGTVGYMSPERIRGESEDPRSDLYSLGCLLYEGVTGRPPFEGASNAEILDKHLLAPPPRPSREVEGVPAELEDLILRLLAKNPHDRPGHADDVAEALAGLGAEPWPGGRLPAPKPYLYRPALAGRDAELASLQAVLRRAEEGRGSITIVSGPSGIGKTALVMALCRLAWHQGWRVVTGECVPVSAVGDAAETHASPLHPFARLLGTAADLCQSDAERVEEIFGDEAGFLVPFESALASLPGVRPPPEANTLPADTAQERVLRALGHVVGRLARARPLLLIIDDLQWADPLSLAFLNSLRSEDFAEPGRCLVVLGTVRPEEASAPLRSLFGRSHAQQIVLEPISTVAVEALVGAMMARSDPPARLAELAWRESEGHPLLAGETVRTALEQGLLLRDDAGHWQLRAGAEAGLAGTRQHRLATLLARRLQDLDPGARRVMEMAAVLGREFPLELLAALTERVGADDPIERGGLLDGLTELTTRQIIEERRGEAFRFCHDRLRELAYEQIAPAARPALHRAAVDAFEARAKVGVDLSLELGTIAFHAVAAGDHIRAIEYSEQAGDVALRRAANAEAARLYRQALALAGDVGGIDDLRRARWERRAAEALDGIGDLAGAKQHLRRAGALLGWPEPRSNVGLALGIGRQLIVQLWRRNVRQPDPVAGPELLRWQEAAVVFEILVHIHYYQCAALPLMHATFLGLRLAERCPDSPVLSSAYSYGYATLNVTPFRRPAAAYLALAERALARKPDPAAESYTRLMQGVAAMGQGSLADVDAWTRKAMQLAEPLSFRRRWEEAAAVLANSNHFHGESAAALDLSNQIIASARQRHDGQILCWGLAVRAATYLGSGLTDEALIDLREAEPLAAAVGNNETIWVLGLMAAVHLRQGAREAALDASRRGLARARSSPPVFGGGLDGYTALASVPLGLCEEAAKAGKIPRTLVRQTRQAIAAFEAFVRIFPVGRARLELLHGRVLLLRGRTVAAAQAFERSREQAERLRLPADQAMAHLWLALAAQTDSDRGHASLALVMFERCGHYHHSELIRKGLARPGVIELPLESRV